MVSSCGMSGGWRGEGNRFSRLERKVCTALKEEPEPAEDPEMEAGLSSIVLTMM